MFAEFNPVTTRFALRITDFVGSDAVCKIVFLSFFQTCSIVTSRAVP
jgi:hypothetical protein